MLINTIYFKGFTYIINLALSYAQIANLPTGRQVKVINN